MIPVTRTYLPPLDEYVSYLRGIWERNQVTNNGPLVQQLEEELKCYLGVRHLFFVSNGTIALQIAIKALALSGQVITTPFSYVATTSSLVWEGCAPLFVDIDPRSLCLNPDLIEPALNPRVGAILATHVYGIPCDVERIQQIAERRGLKVIYDAAHAFGVKYKGKSLLAYGDIATLSFHATKLFHTVEGGALVTDADDLAHKIRYLRNFGHKGAEDFWGLGINGKNSELHAAMGLCVLPRVPAIIAARRRICRRYDQLLAGVGLSRPFIPPGADYNYAYYPVIFKNEAQLLKTVAALNAREIFPRRYFYPGLNALPYLPKQPFTVADRVSPAVLCLPLYAQLEDLQIKEIADVVITSLRDN